MGDIFWSRLGGGGFYKVANPRISAKKFKIKNFFVTFLYVNLLRAMLQLNPMIPVYSIEHQMEGYAFLVIDYSQEHDLLFTCALDNGEIWTISNKKLRFCKNPSLDRTSISKNS